MKKKPEEMVILDFQNDRYTQILLVSSAASGQHRIYILTNVMPQMPVTKGWRSECIIWCLAQMVFDHLYFRICAMNFKLNIES